MADYLKAVGEHNRLIATDSAYRHSEMLEDMRAEMIGAYYHEPEYIPDRVLTPINESNLLREVNQLMAEQIHLRKTIYNTMKKLEDKHTSKNDPF